MKNRLDSNSEKHDSIKFFAHYNIYFLFLSQISLLDFNKLDFINLFILTIKFTTLQFFWNMKKSLPYEINFTIDIFNWFKRTGSLNEQVFVWIINNNSFTKSLQHLFEIYFYKKIYYHYFNYLLQASRKGLWIGEEVSKRVAFIARLRERQTCTECPSRPIKLANIVGRVGILLAKQTFTTTFDDPVSNEK